jgi:hypothetical protein
MSNHQMHGLLFLAAGLAVLLVSLAATWTMARRSQFGRIGGTGVLVAVSVLLCVAGAVLCWYGIVAVLEG